MKSRTIHLSLAFALLAGLLGASCPAFSDGGSGPEIEALREELRAMREDYEARIAQLEARLDAAEQSAAKASPAAADPADKQSDYEALYAPSPQTVSVARDSAFNPAIGVTFQGQAWAYDQDPETYYIPGFPLGGEAGPAPEGLSLAETEISVSANVDDKFTAMLTMPVVIEDGEVVVELEEAWVETLALPAGTALRMGRFFSNIGYRNSRHFHAWDFADQPLVYQVFLGSQYIDDGLQFRWLAPTDFYLELGAELMRGDRYPAGGAANSGLGSKTLFAKTGGDVGFSNSWQLGLSWLTADAVDRASGDEDDPLLFTGSTDLYIADFVWKWAPDGNSKQRNFKFQAEYLWRNEDGLYTAPAGSADPWDQDQSGWYAQAVYQPFPRWRFGARIEALSGDVPGPEWIGTPLYPQGGDPKRFSLMADWSNSEFSRLRFQYNHDRARLDSDNQFGLQYIFSIGAHGAHTF
jgi:hypothetical protein